MSEGKAQSRNIHCTVTSFKRLGWKRPGQTHRTRRVGRGSVRQGSTLQWEESGIEREVRVAAGWEGFRTEDVYQEELGADMNIW